jgi:hypothetical protein
MSTPSPPSKRQRTVKVKREKKSTQLYNQLKQEGPRKLATGNFVDQDDRLPEQANRLNLWANTYWTAGCRTFEEIAATEQAVFEESERQALLGNSENLTSLPSPSTPSTSRQIQINVTYTHNHIISSSPFSTHSTNDISTSIKAIKRYKIPGRSPYKHQIDRVAEGGEDKASETPKVVYLPCLAIHCSVDEIGAPPALSYATENIKSLIKDWDYGTRLQIQGKYVPLKYWAEVYSKHRPDIYVRRKEIWRQWRVSLP